VNVVGKEAYAAKIAGVALLTNAAGVSIYGAGERRRLPPLLKFIDRLVTFHSRSRE
jgi:hypothetical protein